MEKVKIMIEVFHGIPVEQQRLIYAHTGSECDDNNKTLQQLHVEPPFDEFEVFKIDPSMSAHGQQQTMGRDHDHGQQQTMGNGHRQCE